MARREMAGGRGMWILVALVFAWPVAFVGQTSQGLHLSESTSDYIRSLEEPAREEWQKPELVIEKVELKPGQSVADIGAGSGYFSVRLARAVGPSGRVFAVDIEQEMLNYVADRAKRQHLENIQSVLAEANDPKLAPSSVDLIFICDTLHHISERDRYYPLLVRALKPGGRLVNVDFQKRKTPFGPPMIMRISREAMIDEVKPAGFRLVKEFDFLPYQYFLVFEH